MNTRERKTTGKGAAGTLKYLALVAMAALLLTEAFGRTARYPAPPAQEDEATASGSLYLKDGGVTTTGGGNVPPTLTLYTPRADMVVAPGANVRIYYLD